MGDTPEPLETVETDSSMSDTEGTEGDSQETQEASGTASSVVGLTTDIDEAVEEVRAQGTTDKREIGRILKDKYGFSLSEITRKLHISKKSLYPDSGGGSAANVKDVDAAVQGAAATTILTELRGQISARSLSDLQESLKLGDGLREKGLGRMASEAGFSDSWEFLQTTMAFYQTWHDTIVEQQMTGSVGLPQLVVTD